MYGSRSNKSTVTKSGDDIIYYNINMTGNPNEITTPANFYEERTQPILENPSDYYMSVIRFSLDGSLIPIFICPIIYNTLDPNDINLTPFIVTLRTATASYSQNVRYVPENNRTPLPVPPSDPLGPTPIRGQDLTSSYYYIYTYTRFIAMVNQAIQIAFNNLTNAEPAFAGSFAPSFTFDSATRLITLHVTAVDGINTPFITPFNPMNNMTCANIPPNYNQNNPSTIPLGCTLPQQFSFIENEPIQVPPANKIYLYMNESLFSYFDALETFTYADDPIKSQLFICRQFINNLDTATNSYFYTQQYNISSTWNSLGSIVFTTSHLPVQVEYIPSSSIVSVNGTSNANFKPILTDFVPNLEETGSTRSRFIYYPSGQFRLIDLHSQIPLRKIDLQMFWQDQYQNLYPLYISYNESNSVKLMFIKKSMANNSVKHYDV